MNIACCYRLIPNGEVIHADYDSDSYKVNGMPDSWFQIGLLELPEYSRNSYLNCDARFDEMCETILLSNPNYALVVENNNVGYYVLQFDGVKKFVRSVTDYKESSSDCYIPNRDNYKAAGYRRTKQRQIRASDGIYRLTLDILSRKFVTDDGVLTPEFDINSLGQIDFHYAGYKDMIANGSYAVVYVNGQPVFLDKTVDNKLVMRS